MDKGLKLAIEAAGSARRLAAKLGVSQQAVQQWQRIPAERIIEVQRVTLVPRDSCGPISTSHRDPTASSAIGIRSDRSGFPISNNARPGSGGLRVAPEN